MPYPNLESFGNEGTEHLVAYLETAVEIRDIYITSLRGQLAVKSQHKDDIHTSIDLVKSCFQEMIFSRGLDNFQTYVTHILSSIFELFPHAFFKGKVDTAIIFQTTDLNEIRSTVIEREVRSLSYKSILDLDEFMSKNLGFRLFSSKLQALRIQHLIYRRNLVVHNRGRVSKLFKELTGRNGIIVGERIKVPYALRTISYLDVVAAEMDGRARLKFNLLPVTPHA